MAAARAPHPCASPHALAHLTPGMCRRDLLVAAGSLLMSGGVLTGEVPAKALLFDHKWTFETEAGVADEEFTTRFGLVQFGQPSSKRPLPLELPGEAGWQTCSDPAALARTSQVLFLAGLGTDRAERWEAIACPADGFVVDLRPVGQTADRSHGHVDGPEHIAVSDFVRAYIQQVVAFDLEDARATLADRTPCQVAISVCSGEKSAISASVTAAERAWSVGQGAVKGQLLLLTFGSPAGCLRQSKEAFNACRARLPAGAVAIQAAGVDARLPPGTVRASVFASHS